MIIDFQNHYTPPELMERFADSGPLRLDERGNPNYRFTPLLADLAANVRMMDRAGIDLAVLSCGSGFDQPDLATCRLINDRMHQAERDFPGRFVGLAHVPALDASAAAAELKRCAVELGEFVALRGRLLGKRLAGIVVFRGDIEFLHQCQSLVIYRLVIALHVLCKGDNVLVVALLQRLLRGFDVKLTRRVGDMGDLGIGEFGTLSHGSHGCKQ